VPQVVLDQGHRWKDHTATAHLYLHASPSGTVSELSLEVPRSGDPRWRALWEEAERRTLEVLDAQSREEVLEPWILEAVAEVLPEGANLLVANSMPIRDLDAFGRPRPEPLNVFANRGASGIDGLVSTAAGISAMAAGPTVGVLGDLAFFHDMNGLMAPMQGDLPVGFVVVNNDGGGIFHTLPVRAFDPAFTQFFATPHGLDFRHAAELYQLPFERADSLLGFREALLELTSAGAPFLLEVPTRRQEGHARREEILAEVTRAVEALGGDGWALNRESDEEWQE
jgi:2-succinyl-5-enolpyruvyl-6-hydroxy-3-cyclohexene-1-carboxylate synthase